MICLLRMLKTDAGGVVALTVALLMPVLGGFAALAVDMTRYLDTVSRMDRAAELACKTATRGSAGGQFSTVSTASASSAKFLFSNMFEYSGGGAVLNQVSADIGADGVLTLNTEAAVDTPFAAIIGIDNLSRTSSYRCGQDTEPFWPVDSSCIFLISSNGYPEELVCNDTATTLDFDLIINESDHIHTLYISQYDEDGNVVADELLRDGTNTSVSITMPNGLVVARMGTDVSGEIFDGTTFWYGGTIPKSVLQQSCGTDSNQMTFCIEDYIDDDWNDFIYTVTADGGTWTAR